MSDDGSRPKTLFSHEYIPVDVWNLLPVSQKEKVGGKDRCVRECAVQLKVTCGQITDWPRINDFFLPQNFALK